MKDTEADNKTQAKTTHDGRNVCLPRRNIYNNFVNVNVVDNELCKNLHNINQHEGDIYHKYLIHTKC